MKLGVMFANGGSLAYPELLAVLATAADEFGFESIWSVEHVLVPVGYRTPYPYNETGKMPGGEGVPISDPIVCLAFAAALTKRVRLGTGVLILPQRHPAYVAKEIATVDVLSHGRAILGVGIGWLREEFEALGVPFADRAARAEESVRAIRSLWRPPPEPFEGHFYRWGPVESNPKPVQPGGVPIVVGGHSPAAARRAARCGNGFFPVARDEAALRKLLAVLRDECERIGRDPAEVEISAGAPVPLTEEAIRRHEAMGVSRLLIPPPAYDPDGLRRGLQEIAVRFIARRGSSRGAGD